VQGAHAHGGRTLEHTDRPVPVRRGPPRVAASDSTAGRRQALIVFIGLAAAILVADQLVKQWILASFQFQVPVQVLGDYVRIVLIHNNGGLFGMFRDQATLFAIASVAVMGGIVWFEARIGRTSLLMTVTLGLLLGGALGNLVDRIRFGYVVDFVDMGVGGWRWYTYNVADSAISLSIVLLLLMALLPMAERPGQG
jgi:signal peptidase II